MLGCGEECDQVGREGGLDGSGVGEQTDGGDEPRRILGEVAAHAVDLMQDGAGVP